MKFIVAIDSFKGCLSSIDAGRAAAQGIGRAQPDAQIVTLPVSDGGEGMLDAFTSALGGKRITVNVHDPLMRPIKAQYGLSDDGTTAIIEIAQASGLTLLTPNERDPLRATSYGTGELMADALNRGCTHLLMGLGGSATSDGGMGMLQALGVRFDGHSIDLGQSLLNRHEFTVTVASDVQNPLCGPDGAAHVYGPQKGATIAMVRELDERLLHFAQLTTSATGIDHSLTPGAGAAGGLGFALLAYMNAALRSGTELLLDAVGFDLLLKDATLVITGEGSADRQTLMGKLPYGIMRRAARQGVNTTLIAGRVADADALVKAGFNAVRCVNPPQRPVAECMKPQVASDSIAATVAELVSHLAQ